MPDRFIAVAGNMGVGKTTLVEYLESKYQFRPVFEPFENNPYLKDFYKDMRSWAFHSQSWFLSHKFRLHLELQQRPGILVQDRTIYEDAEIFATHLYRSKRMSKRDFETYLELYQAMKRALKAPDLLIYLKCGVRTIRKRIKTRGRANEQEIPVSYIRRLNKLYEEWIADFDLCPVLVWDTERLNYLSDLVDRIEFNQAIEQVLYDHIE